MQVDGLSSPALTTRIPIREPSRRTRPLADRPAFEQDPGLDEILERIKAASAKAPAGGWLVGQIGAKVLDDPRATPRSPGSDHRRSSAHAGELARAWHRAEHRCAAPSQGGGPGTGSAGRVFRPHDGRPHDHRPGARVRGLYRPQTLPPARRSCGADQGIPGLRDRGRILWHHVSAGDVDGRAGHRRGELDRGCEASDQSAAHRLPDDRDARLENAGVDTGIERRPDC